MLMMPGYEDASKTPMKKRRTYMPVTEGTAAMSPVDQRVVLALATRAMYAHRSSTPKLVLTVGASNSREPLSGPAEKVSKTRHSRYGRTCRGSSAGFRRNSSDCQNGQRLRDSHLPSSPTHRPFCNSTNRSTPVSVRHDFDRSTNSP